MSFISKFKSDTAYSNADINEVISAITGAGVLPSSPNDILSNLAEEGVSLSDERCAVSWANEEKSAVKIGTGTVIMPDGSYIIVSDEILPVSSADKHYVYIYNDLILQNVPMCQTVLPDSGRDYILLAEVENGKILDKRPLATSKIASYGTHPTMETSFSVTVDRNTIPAGSFFASVEVGNQYSKALIRTVGYSCFAVYDIASGLFDVAYVYNSDHPYENSEYIYTNTLIDRLYISYADGKLNFYSNKDAYYIGSSTYTFLLTLF